MEHYNTSRLVKEKLGICLLIEKTKNTANFVSISLMFVFAHLEIRHSTPNDLPDKESLKTLLIAVLKIFDIHSLKISSM